LRRQQRVTLALSEAITVCLVSQIIEGEAVDAKDDWMQQFVADAKETVKKERTQQSIQENKAVQKEQWYEVNLSIREGARQRIVEAITRTLKALKDAGCPGMEVVYQPPFPRPPWQGWYLDDSHSFFLLDNGDMATLPSTPKLRKKSRHSPEAFATLSTYTKYKEYAHSDDRHGVERDELLTPPGAFQKWVDKKVTDTAKELVTLLARYDLRP
jgi:hypothetical protein